MCHRLPQQQRTRRSREQALEAQSSELLRAQATPHTRQEYPFYISESSIRQAGARDQALAGHEFHGPSLLPAGWSPVLQTLCDQLRLTETNRSILELTRQGYTRSEIAQRLDLTVTAVRRRQERIIARLRHAAGACGRANQLLLEAYEEQLEQHRYQPEQHCAPGREACRRDGKCLYRWYLYSVVAQQEMA